MGKTGSGKSSVLNSLTRTTNFKIGHKIISTTKEVKTYCGKFKGRLTSPDIIFIDTPGFFDTGAKDNKIIADIAKSLSLIEDGINLILFCFPSYEIRMDASIQACWKFLKLIMGAAVYEHVIVTLTHGDRLSSLEFENAIARMTTEFIPSLRAKMNCKVRDEILIYQKGKEDDGLDDVLKYITTNDKYVPAVMEDLGRFWDPTDPLRSIDYLLQNSQIFNKIQDLILDTNEKNENIKTMIKIAKNEILSATSKEDKEIKEEFKNLTRFVNKKIEEEMSYIRAIKSEMQQQFETLKKELANKENEVSKLKSECAKKKTNNKPLEITTDNKENKLTKANEVCITSRKDNPEQSSSRNVPVQVNYVKSSQFMFKTMNDQFNSTRSREITRSFNNTVMGAKRSVQGQIPEKLNTSYKFVEYPGKLSRNAYLYKP